MAKLEIENVVKVYPNGFKALSGVSVTIDDSKMLAVVGPSGCGKSSLLRCVAGLEKISAGEMRIDGESIVKKRPDERDIAMVFQNYALYPHMSIYNNLAYGLRNRKMDAQSIKKQITETAELLHIEQLLDRKPAQLSGGQRQRVAMGRAIVRHPRVFLFDEPLSNLDAKLRTHMRVEVKRLQQRQQVTSMFVTHDQIEAMTLGDTILLLNDGKVEQIGTPDDLFNRPVNTYVAGFIGSPSMNILNATVSDEKATIDGIAGQVPLTAKGIPSGEVLVGIRPQDLFLVEKDKSHALVTVDVVESLGDTLLLHGTLGNDSEFTVQLSARDTKVASGDQVSLQVENHALHYFDKATTKRIESS